MRMTTKTFDPLSPLDMLQQLLEGQQPADLSERIEAPQNAVYLGSPTLTLLKILAACERFIQKVERADNKLYRPKDGAPELSHAETEVLQLAIEEGEILVELLNAILKWAVLKMAVGVNAEVISTSNWLFNKHGVWLVPIDTSDIAEMPNAKPDEKRERPTFH